MPTDIEAGHPPPVAEAPHLGRRARRRAAKKAAAVGADATLSELADVAAPPFGVAPREVARVTEVRESESVMLWGA